MSKGGINGFVRGGYLYHACHANSREPRGRTFPARGDSPQFTIERAEGVGAAVRAEIVTRFGPRTTLKSDSLEFCECHSKTLGGALGYGVQAWFDSFFGTASVLRP